jgi:hypothetical protein
MKDYDGDEDDGYDETIYPVDHAVYGQLVDDVSFHFISPLLFLIAILTYKYKKENA